MLDEKFGTRHECQLVSYRWFPTSTVMISSPDAGDMVIVATSIPQPEPATSQIRTTGDAAASKTPENVT